MGQEGAVVIASSLALCTIAIVVYEIVKWMETEITLEKLAAAGVCAFYIIVLWASEGLSAVPVACVFFIPLGLIWFGDELGSTTGIKMGLVKRQSPGFLVRLIGWLGLVSPVVLFLFQ